MVKNRIIKKETDKTAIKINIAMSILLVAILSFISIGYALYGQNLSVRGTTTFRPQGEIEITDVTLSSSKNVRSDSIPAFTASSVDFNLTFEKAPGSTEPDYQAIYSITITNNTFYNHEFSISNFQPVITNSSGISVDPSFLTISLEGISMGDMIPALDEVTFNLILDFTPDHDDTYSVSGDLEPELDEEPDGSLLGSLTGTTTGNLKESLGNDIVSFSVEVINSYRFQREFTIEIVDTSHFAIVNSSGNALPSITIEGGETNTYTFYVKRVDNAVFATDSYNTGINIRFDGKTVNCGSVTLLVDEQEIEDTTPPVISNVNATINNATSNNTSNNNVGSLTVTWSGTDAESGVKKYYVISTVGGNSTTYETTDNTNSLTITGLADGAYTFKVYGENNHNHKPSNEDIAGPCVNQGTCAVSSELSFDWHYDVSFSNNSEYMKALTNTKVNRGYDYTTTLNVLDNANNYTYTRPTSVTVTMGGTSITTGTTTGHFSYTNNNGSFTVYGATGDIVITARGTRSGGSICGN